MNSRNQCFSFMPTRNCTKNLPQAQPTRERKNKNLPDPSVGSSPRSYVPYVNGKQIFLHQNVESRNHSSHEYRRLSNNKLDGRYPRIHLASSFFVLLSAFVLTISPVSPCPAFVPSLFWLPASLSLSETCRTHSQDAVACKQRALEMKTTKLHFLSLSSHSRRNRICPVSKLLVSY
jgi:hypothetical protein